MFLLQVTRTQGTAGRPQRRLEDLQGLKEAGGVEEESSAGEGSVSGGTSPYIWQHDEEGEDREEEPTTGCPREESGERGSRGGDKDYEEKGVVKPAERLRVHDAKLDEQAQYEVQEKKDRGGEEDRGRNIYQEVKHSLQLI